jgi:hypothetical protein
MVGLLLFSLNGNIQAGRGDQSAKEGWQGLAMSLHEYCGIDDVILRYEKALQIWMKEDLPPVADNGTLGTKACTACIAADRAVRVFAALALDRAKRPKMAAQLRHLPPIRIRREAKEIFERIADMPEVYLQSFPDGKTDGAYNAIQAALRALLEASESDTSITPIPTKGCIDYEGHSEFDSSVVTAIEEAANAGVPDIMIRGEALRLLHDLIRASRRR